jgi:predicted RNase H-like HicB family nuclease
MKPKANLSIEVKFTPVFKRNKTTNKYSMYYKEFPQAIALGTTKREAELNLIETFIATLIERKEKIRERFINNYYADSK